MRPLLGETAVWSSVSLPHSHDECHSKRGSIIIIKWPTLVPLCSTKVNSVSKYKTKGKRFIWNIVIYKELMVELVAQIITIFWSNL